MNTILIIDDDKALCRSLEIQLTTQGHEVKTSSTAAEGIDALDKETPDLVLLDLVLPDQSGLEVLRRLRDADHSSPVVMITGRQDMKATIEAMRAGAFDYLRKPFELDDVLLVLEKAKRFMATKNKNASKELARSEEGGLNLSSDEKSHEIIGADKKIIEIVKQIGLLSRTRVTVLIEGESGTGKELVARALHEATTPDEPFVAINCSALVPSLTESELFGHEKGAFTGAHAQKIGKMEFASKGTVFLDEIGDMPYDIQAKILRAIQECEFQRVGGLENIPFKARTITATNSDLDSLVRENKFREDLYYRLAVTRITLPPLRERIGDIPILVQFLMESINNRLHRKIKVIDDEVMRRLMSYDWPGNVRELENILTRAVALARGDILTLEEFKFLESKSRDGDSSKSEIVPLAQAEAEYIKKALIVMGWNITHTARVLQISPTTLRKKITDYSLK